MGDKIVIKEIVFINSIKKYQIDLYNETKDIWYRTFIGDVDLKEMLDNARAE